MPHHDKVGLHIISDLQQIIDVRFSEDGISAVDILSLEELIDLPDGSVALLPLSFSMSDGILPPYECVLVGVGLILGAIDA